MSRYDSVARVYDLISGERLLYRAGRCAAHEMLNPQPGERVLVVGCGTGLDFPELVEAVGASGEIIGVDNSRAMLRRAQAQITRAGWRNVRVMLVDAADLSPLSGPFDAVLFTYSLAVIDNWREAWIQATQRLRPGGRVAVVDTDLPARAGLLTRLLATAAMRAGGVDYTRQVWGLVAAQTSDPEQRELARGHIRVAVGTSTPR